MKLLIYTIAIDVPGENHHWRMAKILVESILRNGFEGEVFIFTNAVEGDAHEYGPRIRQMLCSPNAETQTALSVAAKTFKFAARTYIPAEEYSKIMFVDCDCVFQQNPESLFAGNVTLMYAEETWSKLRGPWHRGHLTDAEMRKAERPGINSGVWWVRGEHFKQLMEHWEEVQRRKELRRQKSVDQSAWVRVVLDTHLPSAAFHRAAIRYPYMEQLTQNELNEAVLFHFANPCSPEEKLARMLDASARTI